MSQTPQELKTSRVNAMVPAAIAVVGVVLAAILSYSGARYATTNTINADREKFSKERSNTLEDRQRGDRKESYEKFLVAAHTAVAYERSFWCDADRRAPAVDSPAADYVACAGIPPRDGPKIVHELRKTVPAVILYAGDDTRNVAYDLVTSFSWLVESYKKHGTALRASTLMPDKSARERRWQMENMFLDVASKMCIEQSVLPNRCAVPVTK